MRKGSCVSDLLVVKDSGESPVEEFGHLLGRPGLSSDEGLANDKHHLGRLLGERESRAEERKKKKRTGSEGELGEGVPGERERGRKKEREKREEGGGQRGEVEGRREWGEFRTMV